MTQIKKFMKFITFIIIGVVDNIINDRKVQGNFVYEFKNNEVDVHIIDAELKNDPTFKFKIWTGFSEGTSFKVVYDYKTN